jgi:peptidoglycan/xylan/chitin deacetylase (PgdA/CDA1 family)
MALSGIFRGGWLAAVTLLAVTAACDSPASPSSRPSASRSAHRSPSASHSPTLPAPASVHANELAPVPVLMVHEVEADPQGDYAQTPAQFRATLEYLAGHGYVPITAAQLVRGDIDVPAGASPVVLTFDDGLASQFRLTAAGVPDPASAVGILLAVAREHPGFTPVATCYVNRTPFAQAQPAAALRWLVGHGFEIGNHTYDHTDLGAADAGTVQRELASQQRMVVAAVPGYAETTMALPYGSVPSDAALAHHGAWQGTGYDYGGVMLVGAGPAPSPFSRDWDPYAIPRIRSWHGTIDFDQSYWLPRLATDRYVSDGDPKVISYPRAAATGLRPALAARARPY